MKDASGKTIMLFYNTFPRAISSLVRYANSKSRDGQDRVVVHDAGPVTHQLSYLVTP